MGLLKNNQKGFTLVEVMIAAAIMGAMAMYFTRYFTDLMKQQNTVMTRMEETSLLNDIRLLLMKQDNCTAAFKGIDITYTSDNILPLNDPIKHLYRSYKLYKEDEVEEKLVEKFFVWEKGKKEVKYGQKKLKISNYSFKLSKDNYKSLIKFKQGEIEFIVTVDRGQSTYGSEQRSYTLPLELALDDSNEITSCSSMGMAGTGGGGIVVLDSNKIPTLMGKTGNEACKTKALSCAYVQSTNYLLKSTAGVDTAYYSTVCVSSYNQTLPGIKSGGGVSNIHSCEAKLGVYETFQLAVGDGIMNCAGTFLAICN